MTALKLQAFLKAGLMKDLVFEAGDACAAGRPQPTSPEKVWKAEWGQGPFPKGHFVYVHPASQFNSMEVARLCLGASKSLSLLPEM